MCGIAGKISLGKNAVKLTDLKVMSKTIQHRGPDDEGFYISEDKQVGLVNRRLAIIDLTKRGHQPMSYKGRFIITFNGEIYNFGQERKKLQKLGYRFHSKTDTEVILALYDKYGTKCLSHLRGMFAFVLYDKKTKTIFGARDRIGKKPFKYYWDGNNFIFSSELKSIVTQKEVSVKPDFLAIDYYLTYGYTPSPLTGFEGIKKLPPASYLILDTKSKKLQIKSYWSPDFSEKLQLSESDWIEKILSTIDESVKLRMIADVPIGVFLSGGVDSSAVVATMAKVTSSPIKTFVVGFKDKKYNESHFSRTISKLYKTDHAQLIVEPKSIEMLPMLTYQYEEPFADASATITFLISELARKHVTVVLNGDGGDENFAGYDRHIRIKRDAYLDKFSFLKSPTAGLLSLLRKHSDANFVKQSCKFIKKSKLPLSHRYVSYNRYFSESDKTDLYSDFMQNASSEANALEFAEKSFKSAHAPDARDQGLYFDLTCYLPEDLLAKVDIASMANSLEARSPLLDHKLIELAAQIPYNLKVKGRETKYILKKAFEKSLPKENLYRKKMGFSVPLDKWFSGNLNKYTKSKLLQKKSITRDFFKQDQIKKMLASHSETNDFGPRLWSLLTLELWFENYFN